MYLGRRDRAPMWVVSGPRTPLSSLELSGSWPRSRRRRTSNNQGIENYAARFFTQSLRHIFHPSYFNCFGRHRIRDWWRKVVRRAKLGSKPGRCGRERNARSHVRERPRRDGALWSSTQPRLGSLLTPTARKFNGPNEVRGERGQGEAWDAEDGVAGLA